MGVDDFAFRRGKRYGTILIDLEKRCVIDLLQDRESSTLEAWLKAHKGVELVTCDRSRAYAEAISAGAPDAVQVADRWHLIKNLCEAFERLLSCQHRFIRDAANPIVEFPQQECHCDAKPNLQQIEEAATLQPGLPIRKEVLKRRSRHIALYNEVIELKQKGLSVNETRL
ncbi:MAG: transposase [Acidobacteriota bacterium]